MKRLLSIIAITVLAVFMLAMVSCGKHEFSGNLDDDKNMTINAVNADTGDYFVTGTLVVEDGEQVSIDTALEKGEITIEFLDASGLDDPEEVPDVDALEAVATVTVSGNEETVVGVKAGNYLVKATGGEKATGTVDITVRTAGDQDYLD